MYSYFTPVDIIRLDKIRRNTKNKLEYKLDLNYGDGNLGMQH